jgi:hypothetical protein
VKVNVNVAGVDIDGHSPLKKIIVPDADTNLWVVEPVTLTVAGSLETYLFCGDFGGKVYVYEITDVVDQTVTEFGTDDVLPDSFRLTTWESPPNLFDDQPSEVFDIAVDAGSEGKATVYVGVARVGIEVLEFDPLSATPLQKIERLQTPGRAAGLEVRVGSGGEHHLLVTDYGGGIRIYGAPQE